MIEIKVENKRATLVKLVKIVCGNATYKAHFEFDDEWAAHADKVARFVYGGNYVDVPFTGNECDVPVLNDTASVSVGVYVDGVLSSAPVTIPCEKSIRCLGGKEIKVEPTDVTFTYDIDGNKTSYTVPAGMTFREFVSATDTLPALAAESGIWSINSGYNGPDEESVLRMAKPLVYSVDGGITKYVVADDVIIDGHVYLLTAL